MKNVLSVEKIEKYYENKDNITKEIDNNDITRLKFKNLDKFRQNELGFIFQNFNLLYTLIAYENIALTLTIKGKTI